AGSCDCPLVERGATHRFQLARDPQTSSKYALIAAQIPRTGGWAGRDAMSFWSTAIARFYPVRASFHRQLIRLTRDPTRTWVRSPIPERTLLRLQQLPSLLADGRTRRALLRYFLTDVGVGLVSRALYHGLRLLPFDTSSAIGGALGRIVGRWRGIN